MSKIKAASVVHADKSPLKVGLVQTAYANGSSTAYVKNIMVSIPLSITHHYPLILVSSILLFSKFRLFLLLLE